MLHRRSFAQDFSFVEFQQTGRDFGPRRNGANVVQHGRRLKERDIPFDGFYKLDAPKVQQHILLLLRVVVVVVHVVGTATQSLDHRRVVNARRLGHVPPLAFQKLPHRVGILQLTGAKVIGQAAVIVQSPHALRSRGFQPVSRLQRASEGQVDGENGPGGGRECLGGSGTCRCCRCRCCRRRRVLFQRPELAQGE